MSEYKRLKAKQFARPDLHQHAPDARYWRKFIKPVTHNFASAPQSITFSEHAPHEYAVCASTGIAIFSKGNNTVLKNINKFKDITYSGMLLYIYICI